MFLAVVVAAMFTPASTRADTANDAAPLTVAPAGSVVCPAVGASGDATLPSHDLLDSALRAYHRVDGAGLVRTHLLTVIDYSLPSTERRLWVIDPERMRVLFHEFVAHGRGSATEDDPERAVWFGNDPDSRRSSLGTFVTGETYEGTHGHSLEMIGLDPGVNDRAVERRIVIHPAAYVSASHRAEWGGRIGRSWGCPALDPAVAAAVIDRIREGSVVYAAGPSSAEGLRVASAKPTTSVRAKPATVRSGGRAPRLASRRPVTSRSGAKRARSDGRRIRA